MSMPVTTTAQISFSGKSMKSESELLLLTSSTSGYTVKRGKISSRYEKHIFFINTWTTCIYDQLGEKQCAWSHAARWLAKPLWQVDTKKFLWISIFVIALRNVATKMAAKTVSWLIDQLNTCAARDGGLMANVKTKYMAWFGAFIWALQIGYWIGEWLLPQF